MKKDYNKTSLACYFGFITQAITANFIPLLFITFYKTYGISLSRLALIPTCFYITQIIVDFFCAKYVDKFGYRKCIIISEISSAIGLIGLAFLPDILPSPFIGIILCTIIYSIGSGLIEVLCSPIIEACPFENKEEKMSLLHSFYCWGTVGVILFSTLFFSIFGLNNWRILACIWAIIPIYNIYNFAVCPIENIVEDGRGMTMLELLKNKMFLILIILMICAGASEALMAQWASALAESSLGLSKTVGDLLGPCGFAFFMGISRSIYGKFGNKINLYKFMIISGIICFICYLLIGISNINILGLIGCMLSGFAVGIMWPGSISLSSSALPKGGTAMFAFLALSGDLGGSISPEIVGLISQKFSNNLCTGVLAGIGFPFILILCVIYVGKKIKKSE